IEAIATGIGAYLSGIDEKTDSKSILKPDIRFTSDIEEGMPVFNYHTPTKVGFKSTFINQNIDWFRVRNSVEGGKTDNKESSLVINIVKQIVEDIRNKEDNRKIILPVFSYHGVGRVANYTKDMKLLEKTEKLSRFVGYKDCLKVASILLI
ncbi:MAG: hypothetical protein ACRC3Y_14470, partial [Romboutsia sp.]|uniref:hypothetical protein n=1 Tax=Romboutsia sp. TaxID=1965302 RepID=UPI003F3B1ED4